MPRSPVTGLLFLQPVLDARNASYMARLYGDLHRAQPALIIVRFPWDHALPAGNPISPWMKENYIRLDTNLTCVSYDLWVRKDAVDLQHRLMHPPRAAPFHRAAYE
jgi:hypothetical protein